MLGQVTLLDVKDSRIRPSRQVSKSTSINICI